MITETADLRSLRIAPQVLVEMAKRETGIDIDDIATFEPLTRFCDSAARSAELTAEGETLLLGKLKAFLKNRLRFLRDIAAHPEILDEQVSIGIVIYGLPRAGTSKLQKLLAASGDFNYMNLWQGLYPALLTGDRNESPDERIRKGKDWVKWNSARSPNFLSAHPFDAESADEEMFAMQQGMLYYPMSAYAECPEYLEWLVTQPPEAPLVFLKQILQYMQWQGYATADKPWLLKCPAHMAMEGIFLSIFPDARFVFPHRNPQNQFGSCLGMSQAFRAPFSDKLTDGRQVIKLLAPFIGAHFAMREQIPDLKVLDLDYLEVVSKPEITARKVYEFWDKPLSDAALARMLDWDARNPQGKHGANKFTMEDFGLNWQEFEPDYREYSEWLATNKARM